jgi:hypothetical protein
MISAILSRGTHELVAVLLAEDRIYLGVEEAFQSIDGSLLLFSAEYVSHSDLLIVSPEC